jgi:hypothetical protein
LLIKALQPFKRLKALLDGGRRRSWRGLYNGRARRRGIDVV